MYVHVLHWACYTSNVEKTRYSLHIITGLYYIICCQHLIVSVCHGMFSYWFDRLKEHTHNGRIHRILYTYSKMICWLSLKRVSLMLHLGSHQTSYIKCLLFKLTLKLQLVFTWEPGHQCWSGDLKKETQIQIWVLVIEHRTFKALYYGLFCPAEPGSEQIFIFSPTYSAVKELTASPPLWHSTVQHWSLSAPACSLYVSMDRADSSSVAAAGLNGRGTKR